MLNFERLLSCQLPLPDKKVQGEILRQFTRDRDSSSQAVVNLVGSVDLLTEYKSALITAAVTGELDVTTARPAVPGT